MNKISVIRKEHFNAAHRLFNPEWSDEKNQEIFGKCNNPNYHGHNYDLLVKLTGYPDQKTGYVFDLKGNHFRLIALIIFKVRTVFILFIGTHNDYNKLNAKSVNYKKR